QQPRHQARLSKRLRDNRLHCLWRRDRETRIDRVQRGLHQLSYCFRLQSCADGDISEWKIFLRPWEIEFHSRGFIHPDGANIANDADDFIRYPQAANEES